MKHYDKLKELIDEELGDYSAFEDREIFCDDDTAETEYYLLEIKDKARKQEYSMKFKCTEQKIYVHLGETWYETNNYDFKVKYFWIALLS